MPSHSKYLQAILATALASCPLLSHAQDVGGTTQGLEPAPLDRCSDSQKSTARAAERLAIYITRPDIINPIITHRDASGSHWIIERFFAGSRVWIPWMEGELKSRFKQMHDRMLEGDVQIKCRECDKNARVVPVFRDRITLCDGFFESEQSYQAAVLIHELSHETFWTDDEIYGTAPSQPWSSTSRRNGYPELLHFGDPFTHAEAYEALTLSVLGEHFDTLFQSVYGTPISKERYYEEIARVQDGADFKGELDFVSGFLEHVQDPSSASEADIDLVRTLLLFRGDDEMLSVFRHAAAHDPLGFKPSTSAALTFLSASSVGEARGRAFFAGQFAAKLSVL